MSASIRTVVQKLLEVFLSMASSVADFRGAIHDCIGPMACFIPSYMPFKLSVSTDLYVIAQLKAKVICTMP